MAIIQKPLVINGIDYIYTKSDEGRYICRDEYQFEDAYDKVSFGRTYTEGDVIVHDTSDEEYAEAGRIMMGVDNS